MAQTTALTAVTLEPRGQSGVFVPTDERAEALGGRRTGLPVTVTANSAAPSSRRAQMGKEQDATRTAPVATTFELARGEGLR